MTADTAPAKQVLWVLAYILRFPGEEGEWAQVIRKTFATENAARAHNADRNNAYMVCRVEIDTPSAHPPLNAAASVSALIEAARRDEREACAVICDGVTTEDYPTVAERYAVEEASTFCAFAIRARSTEEQA